MGPEGAGRDLAALVVGEGFIDHRIERADQNGCRRGRQDQIVEDQRPFPRDGRKQAPCFQLGGTQDEQEQCATNKGTENGRNLVYYI